MADKALYSLLVDLRANTAQLQQDMDKAVGILSRSGTMMNRVVTGIVQGFGQAFGKELINNVGRLSGALIELADAGEEAGSIAENFRKLGGSSESLERARKAVLGTVSAFDLMKVANDGMIRGIPELNKNFAMMAEYAGRFADSKGLDTLDVLQRLTIAISTGTNKSLREFGISIDESGNKSARMSETLQKLQAEIQKYAELTDSVSNANKSFSETMGDVFKDIGIGINSNKEYTKAYRDLESAIKSINWIEVGEGVGFVAGQIASLGANVVTALAPIGTFISQMESMIELVKLGMYDLDRMTIKMSMAANAVPGLSQMASSVLPFDLPYADRQRTQQASRQADLEAQLKAVEDKMASAFMSAFVKGVQLPSLRVPGNGTSPAGGSGFASPGASFPLAPQDDINYYKWKAEQAERVGAGKKGNQEIADDRKQQELKAIQEIEKERSEQAGRLMREQYEAQKTLAEKSTKDWEGFLGLAFTSLKLDPEVSNNLSNLGSQIAAGMFSSLDENQGGLFGLGQTIAAGLGDGLNALFGGGSSGSGSGLGSIFSGAASLLGNGMSTDAAHQAGIQGPGLANGQFSSGQNWDGWISGATTAIGNALNARDSDRQNKDNSGTGQAAGSLGGGIIAGAFTDGLAAPLGAAIGGALGSTIGGMFGWGSQNPETQARHQFANWMEDKLEAMGGFQVRGSDGSFSNLTNFKEGSRDRFNQPGWADGFNKTPGASTFSGLAMGLKEILGITGDVDGQIAAMLGENLANNVDNARHLVQQLGVTFEDVQGQLVEMGKRGEKTWLEIETGIQGAADAFQPGLKAVGDWNQGMQNLLNSGARGFESIQSVRDIFVEAGEAGIASMEQLRQEMLKTYDPEIVSAFFAAANQRGVTTIEAGMKLDDRTAGGFVADMQASGVKFKEVGEQISKATGAVDSSIKEATGSIQSLTSTIRGLNLSQSSTDYEDTEEAFAAGGIVTGPTRALMGEAGPEAILPLTRRNGRLGVALHGMSGGGQSNAVNINIDARGASPGVEYLIEDRMNQMRREILEDTLTAVHKDGFMRGS